MKKTDDRLIHAGLLAVALFYGANYSISKILTPEYITPFGFIIFRILGAGLFFWLMDFKPERIDWRKHGKRLVACAVFGVATNQLLFFKGISLTAAVNGSIIMTLNPVFVFILSAILLKERMGRFKVIGLFISMIGALLIIYQPSTELNTGNWKGDLLILLNALSYGTYLVLAKPLMATYRPLTITKWIFLFGLLIALPIGGPEAFSTDFSSWTMEAWLSALYVIMGVTIFAYFVNIWAMRQVHPSLVGIYIYVQPLFASLIAISIFGERLTFLHIVAAGLIFTGIYFVNRRSRG